MSTYDVVMTFFGFKLILFRVRASGAGMLVGGKEGDVSERKGRKLEEWTVITDTSQPKPGHISLFYEITRTNKDIPNNVHIHHAQGHRCQEYTRNGICWSTNRSRIRRTSSKKQSNARKLCEQILRRKWKNQLLTELCHEIIPRSMQIWWCCHLRRRHHLHLGIIVISTPISKELRHDTPSKLLDMISGIHSLGWCLLW